MFFPVDRLSHLSDQELIDAYQLSADERCLSELFHRYAYLVLFLCNKYFDNPEESRDTVMEILGKISMSLKDLKVDNFKSWLYMVTKNFCLNKIKKNKNLNIEFVDASIENADFFMQFPDFDCLITGNGEVFNWLNKAIDALETAQRECIKLFYFEKKSYHEIAEIKKWDMDQVRSYLQNARRNIKIYLEKRGINAATFKI